MMQKSKKKRKSGNIGLCLILLGIIVLAFGMYRYYSDYYNGKIIVKEYVMESPLHEPLSHQFTDYAKISFGIFSLKKEMDETKASVDVESVDIDTVGTYDCFLYYEDNMKHFMIKVIE